AKVANKLAKQRDGVFVMTKGIEDQLKQVLIPNLWGIGKRYGRLLVEDFKLRNAYELVSKDDAWIQKHLTIVGLRLVHELRGIPCLELEQVRDPRKSLMVSRSFSSLVQDFDSIAQALSLYTDLACERLRSERM